MTRPTVTFSAPPAALDTDIIRVSFRQVIQGSIFYAGLYCALVTAGFYFFGDDTWVKCAAFTCLNGILFYMTGVTRTFPVFLLGTLAYLGLYLAAIAYLTLHVGHEAGFQYIGLLAIPITVVAGRIGHLSKWITIAMVTAYIVWLDTLSPGVANPGTFRAQAMKEIHAFNLAVVALALGMIVQRYFLVVARYQEILRDQASTDPLTGLLNRRRLLEHAHSVVATARRFDRPVSVIIADVDYFKRVNDTHGHDAGDQVLRTISQLLKELAREYDSVCRWGGEEFLVLLPETGLDNAHGIAQRICLHMERTRIATVAGPLSVTMTLGVAAIQAHETIADAIRRADAAMYAGKASGRNQVVDAA